MTTVHSDIRRSGGLRKVCRKTAKVAILAAALSQLAVALSGCGLKGDLYMPDRPAPAAAAARGDAQ